jgi:hypothetical protein
MIHAAICLIVLSLVPQSAPQEPLRVVPGAAPAVKPVYRTVKPDEQRIDAMLMRIECPPNRPVTFIVKAKDRVLKYQAPRLTAVEYISYTPDFKGAVSCGGRTPAEPVLLTWKTVGKTDTAIAVEFLPRK